MLDIKFIRENTKLIKKLIASGRGDSEKADIDVWLGLDKKRSELMVERDEINRKRNEFAETGKTGNIEKIREEAKSLKKDLKKVEEELGEVVGKWQEILDWVPNIPIGEMPEGKGEEDNIVLKLWEPKNGYVHEATGKKARGETEKYVKMDLGFEAKSHLDIGESLGVINIKQSAKTSGSRFSYLVGDIVLLQYAIQQLLFNELIKRKFVPFVPPLLVKDKALYGTSHFPGGVDQVYAISTDYVEESTKLYLIGSTEPPNFAYFMDKTLEEKNLPIKLFAYAPAFRSEVGSWGRDVSGIKRVHQFDKIEMNSVCTPDQSKEVFSEFLSINEWLLQELELPYQLALKCTGDAGYLASSKQVDPEVWLPGQDEWMEVMTATNATDYQARRLNIKYKDTDGNLKYVHTVNDTGVAMGRILISILCNYQNSDGSVDVPRVLTKYLDFEKMTPRMV